MNASLLTVAASGALHVKVDEDNSSNFASLAAMQLTVIPELSTFEAPTEACLS